MILISHQSLATIGTTLCIEEKQDLQFLIKFNKNSLIKYSLCLELNFLS